MMIELSESDIEKIKDAKATFELIASLYPHSNILDSIQRLANKSFCELYDVIEEIEQKRK